MRLLSIVTTNFKKLGSMTADFTLGLNVIAGDNAQGKSTLLEAIGVCLFGVSMSSSKKENIPTWGQTKFEIELGFQLPCGTYSLTRNGSTAKLLRLPTEAGAKPEIVANGNTAVTDEVESLLGLSAKDWNLFVQSEQGSSAGILKYGAAALNRKVEEFAGVDLIDKVQAEAQRQSTTHTGKADAKSVDEEVLKAAEEALAAAVSTVNEASAAVTATTDALEQHGEFSASQPASSAAMRQALADVVTLSNKIGVAEVQVKNMQERVDEAKARLEGRSLQDEAALRAEMQQARNTGGELAVAEKNLQDELAHRKAVQQDTDESGLVLDTRQVEFNADWAEFEEFEEDEVIAEIALLDKAIPAGETDLAARQEEVGKAKGAYDNLSMLSAGAVCPTCNRAKEDHDPAKLAEEAEEAKQYWETRKASVAELQKDITACKTRRTELQGRLAAYNAAAAAVDKAAEGFKSNTAALAGLRKAEVIQAELDAATAELTASREAYAELNAKLKGLTAANEAFNADTEALAKADKALLANEVTLQLLNDELEAMPEPPTDAEVRAAEVAETAYQDALNRWKEKRAELQAAVNAAALELKHCSQLRDLAEEKLTGLQADIAAALEHQVAAKKYSRLVQFLRERRQQYLKEVWDTILGVASKLVRTASKDLITRIGNDDGEFQFEEEGIMAPASSASGAQKAMIGVSLRIGLARALYGKDSLLIFDEPTESCREHNAASLAAMIAGSAKQVLLITHRETDQALAENIVNVGS